MSVILLCSCMCKEGMACGRTPLLRECSPHSEDADNTKANLSSITTLAKLRQNCTKTKKIVWNMDKSWPSPSKVEFIIDIWTTECTRETFCDWWMTLWSSKCTYLENVPSCLMPLAQHFYGMWYTLENPFKNGAGKQSFLFLFQLASYIKPSFMWTLRTSTTMTPSTDWCGFPWVKSANTPEKNLNGRSL